MSSTNHIRSSDTSFDQRSEQRADPAPPIGARERCLRQASSSYDGVPSSGIEIISDPSEAVKDESELGFNIEIELDVLEELIINSTSVPFTDVMMMDRVLLLEQVNQIKQSLPTDLATAIEIVNCKQQIISDAEGYAALIIKSAEERASKMLQDSTIVRQAELDGAKVRLKAERECQELMQATQKKAAQLKQNAIAECQAVQMGADNYADNVLGEIEQKLQQMIGIIQNGRQQLEPVDSE